MKKLILLCVTIMIGQSLSAQFGNITRFSSGGGPDIGSRNARSGDLNNDGLVDVAFLPVDSDQGIYVRWGIPDYPYFDTGIENLIDENGFFELADIDGDDDIDIIVGVMKSSLNPEGFIKVFKNDGTGSFEAGILVESPDDTGARQLIVNDLDQDGDVDILVSFHQSASTEYPQGLVFYENDGSGTFNFDVISTISAYAMDTGDIDGDGDKDLWVTDIITDELVVFKI